MVENPARVIPAALNRDEDAGGDIIGGCDAHSVPSEKLRAAVRRGARRARRSRRGMPCASAPAPTRASRAPSLWPSRTRRNRRRQVPLADSAGAQFVDTVPFGAFKEPLERVGASTRSCWLMRITTSTTRARPRSAHPARLVRLSCQYFARPRLSPRHPVFALRKLEGPDVEAPPAFGSLAADRRAGLRPVARPVRGARFWWGPAWWALLMIRDPLLLLSLLFAFKLSGRTATGADATYRLRSLSFTAPGRYFFDRAGAPPHAEPGNRAPPPAAWSARAGVSCLNRRCGVRPAERR